MNNERFEFLKYIFSGENAFLETISQMEDKHVELFIEIMKGLIGDVKILFRTMDKLRHLAKGILNISHKAGSDASFSRNVELICEVLNCDRASIFLFDKIKNTLWSVHAKGEKIIEIPVDAGIAGSVFASGKAENIEDVYLDKRFNKEIDLKNNYRSKSMLCVPIWNDRNDIIGVCQAINSKNGVFSTDDAKLFAMLAQQAGNSLVASIEYKERDISYELLKKVLQVVL